MWNVLSEARAASLPGFELLERVFGEQYRFNTETGALEVVPSKEIGPRSVQNPNNPDAAYRTRTARRCGATPTTSWRPATTKTRRRPGAGRRCRSRN